VQVEQNPVAPEVKKAEPVKEVKTTTAPKVEVDSKSQKPAVQTPVATSKNVESPKEDSNKFIKTDKSIKTTDNTSKPQTPVAKTEQGDPIIRAKAQRLAGPNIVGKIDLPVKSTRSKDTPVASSSNPGAANQNADNKRKRKRKDNRPVRSQGQGGANPQAGGGDNHQRNQNRDFRKNNPRHQ